MQTIDQALHEAATTIEDIECVALCSTQYVDIIIDDPTRFQFEYKTSKKNKVPSTLHNMLKDEKSLKKRISKDFLEVFYDKSFRETLRYKTYKKYFPKYQGKDKHQITTFGILSDFYYPKRWAQKRTLGQLMSLTSKEIFLDEKVRYGFHYPTTVTIDGKKKPAFILSHHVCHAASSFYNSGFEKSAIITNDGYGVGNRDLTGLFFYGTGNKLYPLIPHHLMIGHLYEMVGYYLGLGEVGSAGKLMGLAPYGRPINYHHEIVGNYWDWEEKRLGIPKLIQILCKGSTPPSRPTAPPCFHNKEDFIKAADAAASTQKLFEEITLVVVDALARCCKTLGLPTKNLCLSGGNALNCPANSKISEQSAFDRVFVEPGCDDSGLAAGAALYTYYNLYGQKRKKELSRPYNPYLGRRYTKEQVLDAVAKERKLYNWSVCKCPAEAAAYDLSLGKAVGWFQGRSEIGPRALGARSLLADPRDPLNWKRINGIKKREQWRPFAPAVLNEKTDQYFEINQAPSPFMLFNAKVKSTKIPAVTHVDGSSRIQTVCKTNPLFYRLIKRFSARTGIPVVLNTSLNGPGEPIVETPTDALRLFSRTKIEVLYLENVRVTKKAV